MDDKSLVIKLKKKNIWIGLSILLLIALVVIFNPFSGKQESPTGKTVTDAVLVLNDQRCDECAQISSIVSQLQELFPESEFNEIDYMTDEGKKIYDDTNTVYLPAILFPESIEDQENYDQISNYLEEKGDFLSLKIGADFDPKSEICDNEIDDTGNGLIDCEDPECSDTLTCNPNLFVDCASEFGISEDTVIFYYSESCPWCSMMKPGIEQLEEQGYSFVWSLSGDMEDREIIDACFSKYIGSGVPQFICLKKNEIKKGAFATAERELDVDAMKTWVDNCIQ